MNQRGDGAGGRGGVGGRGGGRNGRNEEGDMEVCIVCVCVPVSSSTHAPIYVQYCPAATLQTCCMCGYLHMRCACGTLVQ